MASIWDWSKTAADNANSDADINWAENQAPSTVNNSARAMMDRVAEFRDDLGGVNTVGGTANAITVTANSAFTTHTDGRRLSFKASATNTDAATLNVNSIGAKAIRKVTLNGGDSAISAGDIVDNGVYEVIYSADANAAAGAWLLTNPTLPRLGATAGAAIPSGNYNLALESGFYAGAPAGSNTPTGFSSEGPLLVLRNGVYIVQLASVGTASIANELSMRASDNTGTTWSTWRTALPIYGSNANGSYVQHPDGTQFCWLTRSITASLSAAGAIYRDPTNPGVWTFPAAFSATPAVSASVGSSIYWMGAANVLTTTTATGTTLYSYTNTNATVDIHFFATGRWY